MVKRLSRWAPLAGVGYAVLFALVIFATPSTPDLNASTAKIVSFYTSHRGAMQAQTYLLAYCGVLVVVFFGLMSSYLRRMGADMTARIAFAGSIILATAFGIGAAATDMLTHKSIVLDAPTARVLNLINNDLPFIALFVGLLLTMIATGVAILSTRALPTYMGYIAIVAGVGAGIGSFFSWIALMLTGLWTIAASVMLYQRYDRPAEITLPATDSAEIPTQATTTESMPRVSQ